MFKRFKHNHTKILEVKGKVLEYLEVNGVKFKKTNAMKRLEQRYDKSIGEILHQKYTLEKKTMEELADEFITSKGTIHAWLNLFDIKTRSITFM